MKLYSKKCLKCGYYLGTIKCVVSPCTECTGDDPRFPEPEIKSDALQSAFHSIVKKKKDKKK